MAKYGSMEFEENFQRSRTVSTGSELEVATSDGETESNADSEFGDKNAVRLVIIIFIIMILAI